MRAAVYYNNHDIRIEERPEPTVGAGELLVEVVVSGLCASEGLEQYQVHRAPKVMGHEPVGVVRTVGAGVTGFAVGDRVFVLHHIPCLSCHECQRGHFTLCPAYKASALRPGAMCEYFVASAEAVKLGALHVPDNVSSEQAATIEPWACVVAGLKASGIQPGDTVTVVGSGFMGMGFIHMAHLFGAGAVFALDLSDWRLGVALQMGANATINPGSENAVDKLRNLNAGRGSDVVIVTAPTVAAWELGLELAGPGATVHLNSPAFEDTWRVSPEKLYFSETTVTTRYSGSHLDTRQVLEWLATGRIDPQPVLTHRFSLDSISEAFSLMLSADESLKCLIYPGGVPDAENNASVHVTEPVELPPASR